MQKSKNIVHALDTFTNSVTGSQVASSNNAEAIERAGDALFKKLSSNEELLTYAQIVNDIRGSNFSKYNVGDLLESTYYDTVDNVEYSNPWRIVSAPREVELRDGRKITALPLQSKYAQLRDMCFSQMRAFIKCPEALEPGTYNVKMGYNLSVDYSNSPYTKDSYITFTLTKSVPVDGRIALPNGFIKDLSKLKLTSYGSDGKTEIETVNGEKLTTEEGINLGTTGDSQYVRNGNISSIEEAIFGYNIWRDSAIRQYLNSDAGVGKWWEPQDGWDLAPAYIDDVSGYLYELDPELKAAIKEVKVVTNGNNKTELNQIITYDKVILPSLEEMYITTTGSEEGEAFDYYKELNGTDTKYQQNKKYVELRSFAIDAQGTAKSCWLRSLTTNTTANIKHIMSIGYNAGTGCGYSDHRYAPIIYIC